MILKSGKFYDEAGNVVPLEHGNKEQIKILEKIRKRRDAFEGDGLSVDPDIHTRVALRFKCICDEDYINIENEDYDESSALDELPGQRSKCGRCGQEYVACQDEYGDPAPRRFNPITLQLWQR